MISLTLPIVVVALCVNGVGIGGQQVVGVVDALHEASRAGYPDDPATQVTIIALSLNVSFLIVHDECYFLVPWRVLAPNAQTIKLIPT